MSLVKDFLIEEGYTESDFENNETLKVIVELMTEFEKRLNEKSIKPKISTNTHELHKLYKSNANEFSGGCEYEIIKMYKKTCHVQLWVDGIKNDTIYKGIPYNILVE